MGSPSMRLDLDHPGPQLAQHRAAERRGEEGPELEHGHVAERTVSRRRPGAGHHVRRRRAPSTAPPAARPRRRRARRAPLEHRRCAGHLDDRPRLAHQAALGVVDLHDRAEMLHLRVVEQLAPPAHGLGPDVVVVLEDLVPLGQGLGLHRLVELVPELARLGAVGRPHGVLPLLVLEHPVQAHHLEHLHVEVELDLGELQPAPVLAQGDEQHEDHRRERGPVLADGRRGREGVGELRRDDVEVPVPGAQRRHTVDQRGVHPLAHVRCARARAGRRRCPVEQLLAGPVAAVRHRHVGRAFAAPPWPARPRAHRRGP